MLKWEVCARARVGKSEFVLARRGEEWVVRVDDRMLMSTRVHHSEILLAERSIERAQSPRHVLVGGLGLGYTLRAALDRLPADARVTVAELVPDLVEWNRTLLRHLSDGALDDPRCEAVVGDVHDLIARSKGKFDVIVLDVDNGPVAISQEENQRLYGDAGTRACRDALAPGGVLGVWSNVSDAKYVARLERFGFRAEVQRVPAREGGRANHFLFLGTKGAT